MSTPKAKKHSDEPSAGRKVSVRLVLALLLVLGGIAWITYYYLAVRVDPTTAATESGGPQAVADLGNWNYLIGFGLLMVGLVVSSHPSTPMGRGRGVVIGMLGCFLLGLLWIVIFYIFSGQRLQDIPVMNDLLNWNLVVGIGFMAVGFAFATKWE